MKVLQPQTLLNDVIFKLQKNFSRAESESIAYILMEEVLNLNRTTLLINEFLQVSDQALSHLDQSVDRICFNEPVQHVTGNAYFYGRTFKVDETVLIPRPETEELIQLILAEHNRKAALKILDVGTGSGCIATSLSLELTEAVVYAIDISSEAIATARKNAQMHRADIHFIVMDILKETPAICDLDILVSNPPYIMEKEKPMMMSNVLDFEPHKALFVSNDDPLLFYDIILKHGQLLLKPGGMVYFEINENLGSEMCSLCEHQGYANVRLIKDIHQKDRIVSCTKPG